MAVTYELELGELGTWNMIRCCAKDRHWVPISKMLKLRLSAIDRDKRSDSRCSRFNLWETKARTRRTGAWLNPRADVRVSENSKISCYCRETPGRPDRSLVHTVFNPTAHTRWWHITLYVFLTNLTYTRSTLNNVAVKRITKLLTLTS